MAKQWKPGDPVEWDTPQGITAGKIKKKLTSRSKVKGHVAAASKENPQYLVQSDKSGKQAAHKPAELRRERRRKNNSRQTRITQQKLNIGRKGTTR